MAKHGPPLWFYFGPYRDLILALAKAWGAEEHPQEPAPARPLSVQGVVGVGAPQREPGAQRQRSARNAPYSARNGLAKAAGEKA
jgi:hypothetical protein